MRHNRLPSRFVNLTKIPLLAAILTLAVPVHAQGTVVEKVPGDPNEPGPTSSESQEKKVVRGSKEVEEQRTLGTEKAADEAPPPAEQPKAAPDEAAEPERDESDFGHMMQFGFRGGFVLGYGMSFRYDDSPFCKEPFEDEPEANKQQTVCGFGKSPATELALSFAPLDSVEPYLFARLAFGREDATDTEPIRIFGIGARIYTMADSAFKIFVEPALGYEVEGGSGNPDYCSGNDVSVQCLDYSTEYKKDLIFHIGIGPQYDFAKYVGLYLNGGIDVGIFRSISATLFGNLGLQVRIP
jgi:hypothetical protein